MVLIAPRILAKRTSTPPSPAPQNELQKSIERPILAGEPALMYLESEVVDGCLLAVIVVQGRRSKWVSSAHTFLGLPALRVLLAQSKFMLVVVYKWLYTGFPDTTANLQKSNRYHYYARWVWKHVTKERLSQLAHMDMEAVWKRKEAKRRTSKVVTARVLNFWFHRFPLRVSTFKES